jgi:predicted nucleotidyltransferase
MIKIKISPLDVLIELLARANETNVGQLRNYLQEVIFSYISSREEKN